MVTELYYNKTLRYIFPQLELYGDTFRKEIGNPKLNITGTFIMDCIYKEIKAIDKHYCFIVFNNCGKFDHTKKRYKSITEGRHAFKQFLAYAKNHKAYFDDYILNFKDPVHVVIFEFPKETESSISKFLQGKYSMMYSKDLVKKLKIDEKSDRMEALFPKEIIKAKFVEKMNQKFRTNLKEYDFEEVTENEIPPLLSEEYLNYKTTRIDK